MKYVMKNGDDVTLEYHQNVDEIQIVDLRVGATKTENVTILS